MPQDRCQLPASVQLATGRDAERAFVAGVMPWNHATIRALFTVPAGDPVFCASFDDAVAQSRRSAGRVIAWSARLTKPHEAMCADDGIPLLRVEDGFIRSVGLGAGFVPAASLAVDTRGIYYDATRPSDLEVLLETMELSDEQRQDGNAIRREIVAARLSKYNLRGKAWHDELPKNREIVLVPGQVADDASIKLTTSSTIDPAGTENINIQLLRQVRARNPNAYIVYRAHPDVRFGLRHGAISALDVARYADHVVGDVDILSLIDRCDRVETISSLVGFEALLRGKAVTPHGLPFYAGWGLTNDLVQTARRSRVRTIDELTYIAFSIYTRHVDPLSRKVCSIHELIQSLSQQRKERWHHVRNTGLRHIARLFERFAV